MLAFLILYATSQWVDLILIFLVSDYECVFMSQFIDM